MKNTQLCKHCNKKRPKIYSHTKYQPWNNRNLRVFVNDKGDRWQGTRCPSCTYKSKHEYVHRRFGVKKRSENHPAPSIWKAVAAEKRAATHLRKIGFSVTRNKKVWGPDLTAKIENLTWTVEVKCAVEQTRKGDKVWYKVCPITKDRQKDDLIAVVFPKGVYLNTIENHMRKVRKDGHRGVTDYYKELLEREGRKTTKDSMATTTAAEKPGSGSVGACSLP